MDTGNRIESSDSLRHKSLCLNKKIFLSHSGDDKPFVRKLYQALSDKKYDAFFDEETLPKAETITMKDHILEEVQKCYLCVFVLSHSFFTTTKNPMLELSSFLTARKIEPQKGKKLLPLFYKLSVRQFKDRKNQCEWIRKWDEWKKEAEEKGSSLVSDVDPESWKNALKHISDTNGMEMKEKSEEGYIEDIVSEICKIAPPDLHYDVSYTQGMERMCNEVDAMFLEYEENAENPARTCILGMYGMGGLGKTTLSEALFNYYWSMFEGRVIRVELNDSSATLKRLHMVLPTIQNRCSKIMRSLDSEDEAWPQYSVAISWKKVFLIIDNADSECMTEIRKYVECVFHKGSRVMIFSRSIDFLINLSRHYEKFNQNFGQNFHIVEMLSLRKEEAENLFCMNFLPSSNLLLDTEIVGYIVKEGLELCCFDDFYHPLAVLILAGLMNTKKQEDWKAWIQYLSKHRASELGRSVIKLLNVSFSDMEEAPKRILVDLAVYLPSPDLNWDPYEWLCSVNDMEKPKLNSVLAELRNRAFLCGNGVVIHELVKEMAIEATKSNTSLGCVYFEENNQPWERLVDAMAMNVQRLAMNMCQPDISILDLTRCLRLKVVKIKETQGLEKIWMGPNIKGLRSLEVRLPSKLDNGLTKEHQRKRKRKRKGSGNIVMEGLVCCDKLVWMCLENCADSLMQRSINKHIEFQSLSVLSMVAEETCKFPLESLSKCCNQLSVLKLKRFDLGEFCDFSNITQLQSLKLFDSLSTRKLQIGSLLALKVLTIDGFPKLKLINRDLEGYWGFETLTSLQALFVKSCPGVVRLEGLKNLNSLERLDAKNCDQLVTLFEGVVRGEYEETSSSLVKLYNVLIDECPKLTDASAITNLNSLRFAYLDTIKYDKYFFDVLDMWDAFLNFTRDVRDELLNESCNTDMLEERSIDNKQLNESGDDEVLEERCIDNKPLHESGDDEVLEERCIDNKPLNESGDDEVLEVRCIDNKPLNESGELFNDRSTDNDWLNESSLFFNERSIERWRREFIALAVLQPETIPEVPSGIPYHRIFTFFYDHMDTTCQATYFGISLFKMLIIALCRSSQEEQTNITNQLLSNKASITQFLSFMPPTELLVCLVYLWCHGQIDSVNMILKMAGGLESLQAWDRPTYNFEKESKIMHGIFMLTVESILWQPVIAIEIAKRYSSILLDMKIVLDKRDRMEDMTYHLEDTLLPLVAKNSLLRLLEEENVRREFQRHNNQRFVEMECLDKRLRSQQCENDEEYLLEIVPDCTEDEYPYPLQEYTS